MELSSIEIYPALNISFVNEIYQWGIEVIKIIQKIENPLLTTLVKIITEIGTDKFYLPVILIIFWWLDEKQGLRLGMLVIITAWINSYLKELFKQPRPYNLDPSVGLAYEPTYGFPSGHAQMSICFWIVFADWLGKIWKKINFKFWLLAIAMILIIGFSRLYLGVHFPTDVLAGWIAGLIILVVYFYPAPVLMEKYAIADFRVRNITVTIAALIMNGLPGEKSLPAMFLGFGLGYNLLTHYYPCNTQADSKTKAHGKKSLSGVICILIGFLGLGVIYSVLRLMLPGEGSIFSEIPIWGDSSPFYDLGRFLRYGILGLWISAGAPLLFRRLGLVSVEGPDPDTNRA